MEQANESGHVDEQHLDYKQEKEVTETVVRDENTSVEVENNENLMDFNANDDSTVGEKHKKRRRSSQKKSETHVRNDDTQNDTARESEEWPTLGQTRNSTGFSVSDVHHGHGDNSSVGYNLSFEKSVSNHGTAAGDASANGLPGKNS